MTHFKTSIIHPSEVHSTLARHMLVDGFGVVVDLAKSHGSWMVDSVSGREYLDFYSFFASNSLGFNHPAMHTERMKQRLLEASIHKPSNSDKYSVCLAEFVDTLSRTAMPTELPHLFLIEGGSNAVENALKVAWDYRARKGYKHAHDIMHFTQAFHGRSGYCCSLTNTDPNKVADFPKFPWSRFTSPYLHFPLNEGNLREAAVLEETTLDQMRHYLQAKGDTVAAIIVESIGGEGGDLHFRPEFFVGLRALADEFDILLILDEIQCGMGITGKWWAYQHTPIVPDVLVFGKKMQVCGVMVSNRIDDVPDNVFKKSGRINSTWGGSLTDMCRATAILETIENEHLLDNAGDRGYVLLDGLTHLQSEFSFLSNARGSGLMCAIDLEDTKMRNEAIKLAFEQQMIVLPCGSRSIRFRPTLTVKQEDINEGLNRLRQVFKRL